MYVEIGTEMHQLTQYSNEQGLYSGVSTEEVADLKDKLIKRVSELAHTYLTPHQLLVYQMVMDGYTQQEIAKHVGSTQCAVSKSLIGNDDYKIGKRYGGIYKKLNKAAKDDPVINDILSQLRKLVYENE